MLFEITDGQPLYPLAEPIKKEQIEKMVKHYRKSNNLPQLKYAHFRLKDILDFLAQSKVLSEEVISAINSEANQNHIKNRGLRLYLGRHKDKETCPREDKRYKDKATTILVNTLIPQNVITEGKRGFIDLLTPNPRLQESQSTFVFIGGEYKKDGEYGLDKAEIEPPYHDGGYYDIGEDEDSTDEG